MFCMSRFAVPPRWPGFPGVAVSIASIFLSLAASASEVVVFQGTLSCAPSVMTPGDGGFSASVTLRIQGASVTWSRESADVREILSGTLVGNRVALDGYGGNIAPQTRQAGWDWKLRGTLTFADGAASGDIQILSKDGGTLQRQCRFSTAAAVPGVATVPATVPAGPPPAPVGGVGQGGASSSGADVAGQAAAVFGRVAGALLQPGGAGLGGLVGQVVQGAPGPRPSPNNMGAVAAGAFHSGPLQGAPTPYSTKAAFLGAARAGQLLGVAKMTDGSRDVITLVNAVSTILGSEYGVSRLPARSPDCSLQYATHVYQLLHAITEREATSLSDQPPSFRQAGRNYGDTVEQVTSYIQGGRNCDADGFGARQPHPYKAALLAFGGEYQLATRAYIEDEARSRASTYAQRQAEAAAEDQRQRDLAARQEAALRAAEQRRIDAENARIRAEEERRKEIQRNRVGG